MIAKLTGKLDSVGEDWCIVDVNGVGYLVYASSKTLGLLPSQGEAVRLHIETIVREDAFILYGFSSVDERDTYRLLTSVQGVGAKVGLAILGIAEPEKIRTAIAAGDKTFVCQANGVGPKLAGRILNELKDKVASFITSTPIQTASSSGSKGVAAVQGSRVEDAVSALVNLGYRAVDAHGAVARAASEQGENASLQSLITAGLKELA